MTTIKQKLDSTPLLTSKFVDRNGLWAKTFDVCVGVELVFSDDTTSYITLTEYTALSNAQKEKIRNADSTTE